MARGNAGHMPPITMGGLRAAKSQDQKEAIELLSKAILELALSIEATDAKVKKINKSS